MNTNSFKSGVVSIVGKPNVGKSTLINSLIGEKVAIVSDKVQTTRNRIGGILSTDEGQIVFYDTPGIHKPLHKLGRYLVKAAVGALNGSDILAVIVDYSDGLRQSDKLVAKHVNASGIPVFLLVNKVDLAPSREMAEDFRDRATELFDRVEKTFLISALTNEGTDEFLEAVLDKLPVGHALFPEDIISDRSSRFMASEVIREKILILTKEEVPHATGIFVQNFEIRDDGTTFIRADIVVERKTQKPIIIGKRGSMIKKIGTLSRQDMEYIFDGKVYLELFVKVREKWREKDNMIQDLTNLKDELK